jgi:glutathione synthase/RimK-type ligase-like ATP-grasp enzyme
VSRSLDHFHRNSPVTIALATSADWPSLHPEEQSLVPLLAQRGVDAVPVVWNEPSIDWSTYESIVVRSTWDYHLHVQAFRDWIDRIDESPVKVWNPAGLLRMSIDKSYLVDLARAGFATVPSIFVSPDEPAEIEDLFSDLGCSEAVVKPTVAASGFRVRRVERGNRLEASNQYRELLSYGNVMVQPYLASVRETGEWSLIYLGGKYSHAVLKHPSLDDFRVQEEHGGRTVLADAPPSVREVANRVIDWLGEPTLYARIDGFADPSAGMLLSEVELVEPLLFLSHCSGSIARFADEIALGVRSC